MNVKYIFYKIHKAYENWNDEPIDLDMVNEELIKEAISEAINYIPCCTGEAEQLSCEICGTTEEYSEEYKLCYQCWKENHIHAR